MKARSASVWLQYAGVCTMEGAASHNATVSCHILSAEESAAEAVTTSMLWGP